MRVKVVVADHGHAARIRGSGLRTTWPRDRGSAAGRGRTRTAREIRVGARPTDSSAAGPCASCVLLLRCCQGDQPGGPRRCDLPLGVSTGRAPVADKSEIRERECTGRRAPVPFKPSPPAPGRRARPAAVAALKAEAAPHASARLEFTVRGRCMARPRTGLLG